MMLLVAISGLNSPQIENCSKKILIRAPGGRDGIPTSSLTNMNQQVFHKQAQRLKPKINQSTSAALMSIDYREVPFLNANVFLPLMSSRFPRALSRTQKKNMRKHNFRLFDEQRKACESGSFRDWIKLTENSFAAGDFRFSFEVHVELERHSQSTRRTRVMRCKWEWNSLPNWQQQLILLWQIWSEFTHLLHDASFSLGECRVAAQLIVYVLHLNLNASFGFLAVREALDARLLRCCWCHGHCRWSWCSASRWRDICCHVGFVVEPVVRSMLNASLLFQLLVVRVVLFLPLAVGLVVVIALMMTLQIILIVRRQIIGRVELLIGQLTLRKVLMEKFRWVLLKITVKITRRRWRWVVLARRLHLGCCWTLLLIRIWSGFLLICAGRPLVNCV